MNYRLLLSELEELLKSEHITGCEQNTCDINKAFELMHAGESIRTVVHFD